MSTYYLQDDDFRRLAARVEGLDARFRRNLRRARADQGVSRRILVAVSGVSDHRIRRIESGGAATIGEAVAIAEALGLKPGELLRDEA